MKSVIAFLGALGFSISGMSFPSCIPFQRQIFERATGMSEWQARWRVESQVRDTQRQYELRCHIQEGRPFSGYLRTMCRQDFKGYFVCTSVADVRCECH